MLKIEKEDERTFVIRVTGQVHTDEMDSELDRLLAMTAKVRGGRLLYDIREFEMPSLGAMMVEMRKMPQLLSLIGRFDKAAVMAEAPWLRAMAEWEGMLMPGFEVKSFAHKDEKEAREWLMA